VPDASPNIRSHPRRSRRAQTAWRLCRKVAFARHQCSVAVCLGAPRNPTSSPSSAVSIIDQPLRAMSPGSRVASLQSARRAYLGCVTHEVGFEARACLFCERQFSKDACSGVSLEKDCSSSLVVILRYTMIAQLFAAIASFSDLSALQLPHWLIIAGGSLIFFGAIGALVSSRSRDDAPPDSSRRDADEVADPERPHRAQQRYGETVGPPE
jgi:hypothetical protein